MFGFFHKKLDKQAFQDYVVSHIHGHIPEAYHNYKPALRNGKEGCMLVLFRTSPCYTSVSVSLERPYRIYAGKYGNMKKAMEYLVDDFSRTTEGRMQISAEKQGTTKKIAVDLKSIEKWNVAKKNIYMTPHRSDENKHLPLIAPHLVQDGTVYLCRVMLDDGTEITVGKTMLKGYGITESMLFDTARKNPNSILPPSVCDSSRKEHRKLYSR